MTGGVEFEEDKPGSLNRTYNAGNRDSKMALWLISHGLASSSNSAQGFLLVLVTINFVIAYLLIRSFL